MQTTIAITTGSVVISLLLIISVKLLGDTTALEMTQIVASINFNELLLKGMLGFLLFAGALEINLLALRKQRWEITALVLFSTVVYFCRSWLARPFYLLFTFWRLNKPNRSNCCTGNY